MEETIRYKYQELQFQGPKPGKQSQSWLSGRLKDEPKGHAKMNKSAKITIVLK